MNVGDLMIWVGNPAGSQLARDVLNFPFEKALGAPPTPLCALMAGYGSDKGSGWHNYTQLYHHLLHEKRQSVGYVFELGLGTNNEDVPSNMGKSGRPGASLRGWRDYFPNAQIRGADIDRRVLFQDERITTGFCDQTSPSDICTLWEASNDAQFDLMIDDGLHEFHANKTFLENSIHKLRDAGLYVIEDIVVSDQNICRFQGLLGAFTLQSIIVKLPSSKNNSDNCLILMRR